MKSLTISAPDDVFLATVEALCHTGNWQSGDKVEFAKNVLLNWLGQQKAQHLKVSCDQQIDEIRRQSDAEIAAIKESALASVVVSISSDEE